MLFDMALRAVAEYAMRHLGSANDPLCGSSDRHILAMADEATGSAALVDGMGHGGRRTVECTAPAASSDDLAPPLVAALGLGEQIDFRLFQIR